MVYGCVVYNVPRLWYERSLRQGSISSAAVGTISNADISGLARDEYCLTNRAFDASNPGKLAIWAINELLLARSESAEWIRWSIDVVHMPIYGFIFIYIHFLWGCDGRLLFSLLWLLIFYLLFRNQFVFDFIEKIVKYFRLFVIEGIPCCI